MAAAVIFSEPALELLSGFDQAVMPGWRQVVPLVQRLGAYGSARLTIGFYAAPNRFDDRDLKIAVEAGFVAPSAPPRPKHTLYARLPEHT